jgi:UDP-glucose 4-epimerase
VTLFITAATGFVGKHAVTCLSGAGLEILATYRRRLSQADAQIRWFQAEDIARGSILPKMLEGVDAVLHLAGLAHLPRRQAEHNEASFHRVNVVGTVSLAPAAVDAGVRRFVFISSVKASTDPSGEWPLREEDHKVPEDTYGRSKASAEDRLGQIAVNAGLEHVVLRPPLVYGSGVGANFLALMKRVDRGPPFSLSKIKNLRSPVYVDNHR